MKDERKTKAALLRELKAIRRRLANTAKRLSDREQVSRALAESEQRFRRLFEYAPDGYYMNTCEGVFIDGNRAAERIVGYQKEELIGRNFLELDLLSADQINRAAANLVRNMKGLPTGPDEFVLKRKDGRLVHVEISTVPLRFENELVVLAIARDISRRKHAEREHKKLSTELREAKDTVKNLGRLVPVCAWCKRIRDEKGQWQDLDTYLQELSDSVLSHGMCPKCRERLSKKKSPKKESPKKEGSRKKGSRKKTGAA